MIRALVIVVIVVFVLALSLAIAASIGTRRWKRKTRRLHARLHAAQAPVARQGVAFDDLEGLPPPVHEYFLAALTPGQPVPSEVRLAHRGTFNSAERGEKWKPFVSGQRVTLDRPGLVWNATIAVLPGLPVRVHDAYVDGEGILDASLLGLVTLAASRDREELARGELMRFLAETPWYPTALLPGRGVRWQALGPRTARALLADGDLAVSLDFTFGADRLIESVQAAARGRSVRGGFEPTPWRGRFWHYERRQGVLVPIEGEVAWVIDGHDRPYWRGRLTGIGYDFPG